MTAKSWPVSEQRLASLARQEGPPPPLKSKFIADLRWRLELVWTVAGCLRCLASFLLWEGCSIILDTDIVVTELRLSSDNASFRFPYLFICNLFKSILSRTFVSVRRSLVRSLWVGIFISILIEVGYSRFPKAPQTHPKAKTNKPSTMIWKVI